MKPNKIDFNTQKEYKHWLAEIKAKISTTQFRIASTANSVLLSFYWELGKDISHQIKDSNWGTKIIEQLASDLKKEFPDLKGFSRTNLYFIKQFYETFSEPTY